MKHSAIVAELQPDARLILPSGEALGYVTITEGKIN